jgi:hypothetical protein
VASINKYILSKIIEGGGREEALDNLFMSEDPRPLKEILLAIL